MNIQDADACRDRVTKAKQLIKDKGVRKAKALFYDEYFGRLFRSESVRLDNLWSTDCADKEFTEKLEEFANELKER